MLCLICKHPDSWAEFSADGLSICSVCKDKLATNILLVCNHCSAMTFISKTPRNIERLQTFIPSTGMQFTEKEVVVQMGGCPHCVSFQQNQLGERREEVLAELSERKYN